MYEKMTVASAGIVASYSLWSGHKSHSVVKQLTTPWIQPLALGDSQKGVSVNNWLNPRLR